MESLGEKELKEEKNSLLEELEKLKSSYFMMQMQDRWSDDDYKYAAQLRGRINKIELDLRNLEG